MWPATALALLAVAGCGGGGGDPEPDRASLPVTYFRSYGGIVGGLSELRVEADGRATVSGTPPGRRCRRRGERHRFRLTGAELARLRSLVATLPGIEPRTRVEHGVEGEPTIRVEAGEVALRYVGLGVTPEPAEPLVDELERLVSNHC